jgi:23S rRNA (guanosine2251-2'-O)-methyltransferase
MAFKIPLKSLHSFTTKQAVESIYRMTSQASDEALKHEGKITEALTVLLECLNELKNHENLEVIKFSKEALVLNPKDQASLELLLMLCERYKNLDLRENDFLISFQDSPEPKESLSIGKREVHFVLDNIRSAFNVGSFFRTGESFGLTHIHLCGYTATPKNSKAAKSALGTENWISWSHWDSTIECVDSLKSRGFTVFALETVEGAMELSQVSPSQKNALVFGNERYGLASPLLRRADQTVKLSLYGKKNSLNVGVCAGIVAHHFSLDS